MKRHDVIIIGGGHNGLVAAGYLAKAGLKVVVLESTPRLGGPAAKVEFMPGYHCSISNSPASLEPKIVKDLELERHGLRFVKPDPTVVHPFDDGRLFIGHRDHERTGRQLDEYAQGEAKRYGRLFTYLDEFAHRLGVSVFKPPPSLHELVRNLTTLDDQEAFGRIFFGSARDLFEEFELADKTQAILGTLACVAGQVSPSSPGTPMNLLFRHLSLASMSVDANYDPRRMALRGSTGLAVGGMGAIAQAMVASARSRGVDIRTETPIAEISIKDGHVQGVVDTEGREMHAPIVISAINPRTTVVDLVGAHDEWTTLQGKMRRRRMTGRAFKIVLALDAMPRYDAARDTEEAERLASAQFRIAPTLEYLEESYTDSNLGRTPLNPVIWGLCHSMTSPALAPEGRHILSLNIGNAPYRLRQGDWASERDKLAQRCIKTLTRWMSNLPDIIVDYRCIDPLEFEREYGLVEANVTHGDTLPWNQFWMRPLPGLHDYRTPTKGLYLSGNGTWPGNFISGVPGHNTSQAVLDDLRARTTALGVESGRAEPAS